MSAASNQDNQDNQGNRRRRLRLIVRCVVFVLAVILVLPVVPWPRSSLVLPSLSPYVLVGSAIAARSVGVATLVGLPVLLIVVFRRRWFCRYVCPVGLMTEQVGRLRRSGRSSARKLPSLGKAIVLVTLGGACFGYPLLLWLDPLAIFHGVFTLWHEPLSLAGQVSAVALGVILSLSLLLPGAWCLRICPLGATQDLLRPKGVRALFRARGARQDKGALSPAPGKKSPDPFFPRRSLLSMGFGAICFGVGGRWATAALERRSRGRCGPLRPPGSVDEPRFAGLCVRCGNCIRACPYGILEPDLGAGGIAGLLAPVVRFQDEYCREDCHQCTHVCPSGAIRSLPLERKPTAPIGLAVLDSSICLLAEDRECDICARMCPYEAIEIVWNQEEYIALPRVDPERCPGCGACQVACPGTNEWEREHAEEPIPLRKAIEVHPL